MSDRPTVTKGSVSLYPILSVNFVGTLGFSIVLPFLVFLVTRWGGNALIYGVIGATYSVFQLIGAPLLGRWSDIYGRRRVLLLSQIGTLISWIVFLVAFALPETALLHVENSPFGTFVLTLPLLVLFVARAADGLTGGNISVATAYLADISRDEERNANFGKLGVSANLGFILGPAIAGVLAGTILGEALPVMAAVVISIVATLLIVRLPESNPCILDRDADQTGLRRVMGGETKPCYQLKGAPPLSVRQILALPGIPLMLLIYFVVMMGFNCFYVAFPMHAVRGLAWSVQSTGIFFAVLSGMMAIAQGPVLSRVSRIWSDSALVLVGSLLLAASFMFFTQMNLALIYVGAALLAVGNGVMWPSVIAILSRRAGDQHQGAVQGFASSAGAAASIIGLLVGGALFDILAERVFVISAVMILAVFFMALGLRRGPAPEPQPA